MSEIKALGVSFERKADSPVCWTTLIHYIKEVPEVTAKGMAQVEQLFSELYSDGQTVQ